MQLGVFTANVLVDGKPLAEYDIVYESPTEATCWIASEEGKSFGVEWKCHEESRVTASKGSLVVDGTKCGYVIMFPGISGINDSRTMSAFVEGNFATRDLMFARVQLSDDDALLDQEVPKNLGQIRLTIQRGNKVIIEPHRLTNHAAPIPSNKIHERAKKAAVHCVGFGPSKARKPNTFRPILIPNDDSVLSFTFNYLPLGVLQANGIAPRPLSNGARVDHRIDLGRRTRPVPKFEDPGPFQLRDRIHGLENELKRLRQQQATSHDLEDRKPLKRLKKEGSKERKSSIFVPGEVIDLT